MSQAPENIPQFQHQASTTIWQHVKKQAREVTCETAISLRAWWEAECLVVGSLGVISNFRLSSEERDREIIHFTPRHQQSVRYTGVTASKLPFLLRIELLGVVAAWPYPPISCRSWVAFQLCMPPAARTNTAPLHGFSTSRMRSPRVRRCRNLDSSSSLWVGEHQQIQVNRSHRGNVTRAAEWWVRPLIDG